MKAIRIIKQALIWTGSLVALVLVIAYLSGWFAAKVAPGQSPAYRAVPAGAKVLTVEATLEPETVTTVGSVQAIDETSVSARIMAQVQQVLVTPGQKVGAGDVLIELDRSDLEARLAQARAQLQAAEAQQRQAQSDHTKLQQLRTQGAATAREVDDAQRALDVAAAQARVHQETIAEAQTQQEFATLRSPITGIVIDHYVKKGDMARPGQTLVKLEGQLQLVASVPERVAVGLKVGDPVGVSLDALKLACTGHISEIVPEASPASRAMIVKVRGPCPPGVYSGMFGRLVIPQGNAQRIFVPRAAVQQVGQLTMVTVLQTPADASQDQGGTLARRMVRTGLVRDDRVEILAGLTPGERILTEYPRE
ncbi:MAG: efflux RND transporter periplasmic adaptor subunit [Phycisphaeraceae bacterium]